MNMMELLSEYKQSLRLVRKAKAGYPQHKLNRNRSEDIAYGYLSNMETNLNFVIKWLSTGRQPGNIRGVERLDAYQREVSYDPLWFEQEKFCLPVLSIKEDDELPDPKRTKRIEDALSVLTEREREVYKLSRGEGFSFQEIGDMLNIKRGTVCKLIQRAEKKLTLNHRII